jgi:hypothetical protein
VGVGYAARGIGDNRSASMQVLCILYTLLLFSLHMVFYILPDLERGYYFMLKQLSKSSGVDVYPTCVAKRLNQD